MIDAPTLPAALILAGLPSAVYLVILNAIDRYEKEPWRLLLAGVVLGAIAVPAISMVTLAAIGRGFELPLGYAPGVDPDPVARIVEQVVLAALLLGLVHGIRGEFDDTLDGIVYGAAIGAGLGAAETFLYVVVGTGQLGSSTLALLLAAGLNQAFYGAVFGAIAGTVSHWTDRRRAWIVIALGVATAAFLSAVHDTLPAMLGRLVERPDAALGAATRLLAFGINLLGVALLGAVVVWAWGREARILRRYLAPEIAAGVSSSDELARLTSLRARLASQVGAVRRRRLNELRAIRQLHSTLGELAFHNYRTAVRTHRPPPATGEALRERVAALRAQLAASEPGEEAAR